MKGNAVRAHSAAVETLKKHIPEPDARTFAIVHRIVEAVLAEAPDDRSFTQLVAEAAGLTDTSNIDLSVCAYYRGAGTCSFGCSQEPACVTDRPEEGWPSERERPPAGAPTMEGLVPLVYQAITNCAALTDFGKAVEISQRLTALPILAEDDAVTITRERD